MDASQGNNDRVELTCGNENIRNFRIQMHCNAFSSGEAAIVNDNLCQASFLIDTMARTGKKELLTTKANSPEFGYGRRPNSGEFGHR
jgi:hypothetical protein